MICAHSCHVSRTVRRMSIIHGTLAFIGSSSTSGLYRTLVYQLMLSYHHRVLASVHAFHSCVFGLVFPTYMDRSASFLVSTSIVMARRNGGRCEDDPRVDYPRHGPCMHQHTSALSTQHGMPCHR